MTGEVQTVREGEKCFPCTPLLLVSPVLVLQFYNIPKIFEILPYWQDLCTTTSKAREFQILPGVAGFRTEELIWSFRSPLGRRGRSKLTLKRIPPSVPF